MGTYYQYDCKDSINPIIRQPILTGVGLLNEKSWISNIHFHLKNSELLYIVQGNGQIFIDGIWYPVKSGSLVIYNPMQVHQEVFHNNTEIIILYNCAFTDFEIQGLLPNHIVPIGTYPIIESNQLNTSIHSCLHHIYIESCEQNMGYEYVIYNRLETLILYILRTISEINNESFKNNETVKIAMKAKAYIDDNYHKNITLTDIANALFISPNYLSKIFRNHFRISPIQYLLRRRMNEAKRLLYISDITIDQIAQRVSYRKSSHFIAQFKNMFGVSPNSYRKFLRSIDDNSAPWPYTISPNIDNKKCRYEVRKCLTIM